MWRIPPDTRDTLFRDARICEKPRPGSGWRVAHRTRRPRLLRRVVPSCSGERGIGIGCSLPSFGGRGAFDRTAARLLRPRPYQRGRHRGGDSRRAVPHIRAPVGCHPFCAVRWNPVRSAESGAGTEPTDSARRPSLVLATPRLGHLRRRASASQFATSSEYVSFDGERHVSIRPRSLAIGLMLRVRAFRLDRFVERPSGARRCTPSAC